MATETVLVVGSSGNVGVSVIIGALRSNLNVLAIVRNKSAQEKVLQHVDKSLPTNRITFAEADVTDENAIAGIVDQVKAGKLPAFQHVYSTGVALARHLYFVTNASLSWHYGTQDASLYGRHPYLPQNHEHWI